ncbi:hypothetical protein CJ739_109 [Mariniflexile rhizosphaerae]|uniref:hypothetical protein n=1 Tax=unclassified Mariniflexile TaxID=2643887 RepID=UPI000E3338CC|nr:hypothetical protein [Mariniflexile sp. TRM1-10]AXP79209.1 hypothetical protein CJ739_109 [Mariniflexile sp. TRM1-10]
MAEIIKIEVQVRLATKADLVIKTKLLRIGQPYYVHCEESNKIEGVFMIDAYTNSVKLQELFLAKKVYVPVTDWRDSIMYDLQQTDLKQANNYGHKILKNIG